jgi:hypothetical protein
MDGSMYVYAIQQCILYNQIKCTKCRAKPSVSEGCHFLAGDPLIEDMTLLGTRSTHWAFNCVRHSPTASACWFYCFSISKFDFWFPHLENNPLEPILPEFFIQPALIDAYLGPGTAWCIYDTTVNKTYKGPCLHSVYEAGQDMAKIRTLKTHMT